MNKNTICRYPFTTIAVRHYDSQGNPIAAWPCCMMGNSSTREVASGTYKRNKMDFDLEELKNLNLNELFFHKNFEQLRNDLKSGIRNKACEVCWDQEDRGLKSYRQFSRIENLDDKIYENPKIEVVDMAINNLCNLACRMCSPGSSSLLMKDYNYFKKHNLDKKADAAIGRWSTAEPGTFRLKKIKHWQWLVKNINNFEKLILRISGGEPFYNDDVINFLDQCIAKRQSDKLILEFHTNGTLFDEKMIERVKHFENRLNFSIDGHGKVYEYIRYPATWEQLDSSVRMHMKHVGQNPCYHFNFIVMITNIFNIPDFINWTTSLPAVTYITFSEVHHHTRGVSIRNLPVSILQAAKDKILSVDTCKLKYLDLSNLIAYIDDSIANNTENKSKAYDEITLFDLSRNQRFEDYLDETIVRWLKC